MDNNNNIYVPNTTSAGTPAQQSNICPSCGRCRHCGQPAPVQPDNLPTYTIDGSSITGNQFIGQITN